MSLAISTDELQNLYDSLRNEGWDHETLVWAARENYGIDLDAALQSSGTIAYEDKQGFGGLKTDEVTAYDEEANRIAAEQEAAYRAQQEILRQQEEQARIDEYYRQEAIREAERIAAEQEAARQEAIYQEQLRAQQLAAQQEAARQEAARQEAARVAAERTAAENEVKSLYQEVLGRQPTAAELNDYVTRFGTSIDEAEKNTFQLDALKNKLLDGNPDGDELTRRVIIEAVNNKWTPQQTLDFVNTQFGVNKTEADYERAVSDFFAPAVSNLLANGATEAEIRKLGKDQGIIPEVIDAAVRNNIGQIEKNDLANAVKDFYTTEKRTEGGVEKTYISPDFAKLIDYATTNKLSYADVAAAFSSGRPEFGSVNITKDLVYEKDRQQFNTLLKDAPDPKDSTKTIKTVSYGDALNAAITQGISLENLAKFFGKEPKDIKDIVSSNLASFADSLRASGVNPEAGLSDLLGIDPADTKAKLKTFDTDKAITGSLKQKEAGGFTYDEILDVIEASGMTADDIEYFVNRYFGENKTDLIAGLKSEANFTPEERNLRDNYFAFKSGFDKDNPLTYAEISRYLADKKLTDAQATSLFGIPANDLAGYRTDTRLTNRLNEEKADDGKLSLSEILNVIDDSGMDINTFVEKYFGKDQSALATSLTAEKKFTPEQRALRETYNDYIAGLGDKQPTLADVASFVDQNKLTDAQAESVLGVPAKDLGAYRRDTFITSGLNELEKSDNRLDYTEIVTFAKDNNIPFSEVAKYLATPENQESFVKTLEDTQTDMNRTPAERLEFQLNQITSGGTKSGTWDKNSGWEHHADKMTDYLTSLGIKDLTQIGTRVETRDIYSGNVATEKDDFRATEGDQATNYVVYFDKATGKELQAVPQSVNGGMWRFGSEGEGSGSTGYFLAPSQGGVGVTSNWEEKYGAKEYAMPLAFIAAVAAPYLLPELIGGVVGGVELAALGGEAIAGTGLTGSLMSAGIPASVAPYAAQIIVNGVYNGTLSEATGGDFTKGFVTGGLAPVMGQITSNAVNSALADLNLPSGVDRAVGNAVTQLIAKGEIDPLQMLTVGVSPTISKALQDATGLNSAQTKLVLDTVLSQGKNLQALMNPQTALNFVMQNKGVFDGLGLDAASGATNIQTGQAVDLGAFNEDQVRVLQGQDTVSAIGPDTLPGAGIDTVIGAGQDTVSPAVVDTIPGATGLDTAPSITTPGVIDEFQGYDSAIRAVEAIASGATQFEGVEAAQRFLEAKQAGALDYQGYDMARLEAMLIGNQPTFAKALDAAKTLYGPNSTFNWQGQLINTSTGNLAGAAPVEAPGSTEVPMARLPNGMYSLQGFLAAGGGKDPEDYRNYVIGANELIRVTGSAEGLSPSVYNIAAARASDMSTRAGVVAAAYKSPSGQVTQAPPSSYTGVDSSWLSGFGHFATSAGSTIATLGEGVARGLGQNELADKLQQASVDARIAANSILSRDNPDPAITAGVSSGISSGLSLVLTGGSPWAAALGPTMIAMNETWRDGQDRGLTVQENTTRTIGTGMAEYVGESLGNRFGLVPGAKSLGAFFKELPLNPTASQIKDVAVAYTKAHGVEQLSEIFTTALNVVNDQLHGITSSTPQTIDELSDLVANQLKTVFIATNATLGLGGGAFAASNAWSRGDITIDEATRLAANSPVLSPQTGEQVVISNDPSNNLAIVQTPNGSEVVDTSVVGPVEVGDNVSISTGDTGLPEIINNTGIVSTLSSDQGVAPPVVTSTDVPLKQIPLGDGASSPIVDYNQRKIVLVDVDGQQIPFYLSTGLAGKEGVPSGQWYPFFGISQQYDQNGNQIASTWINKGSEQEIASYYGSPTLADIGKKLDESIGDIRFQDTLDGKPIPSISGQALDSPSISAINDGLTPARVVNTPQGMVVISSDAGNLDKSINAVRQIVMPTDNQKFVVDGAIQRIQDGQITTPEKLNDVLQQFVDNGTLKLDQLPAVIGAINQATNISATVPPATGIVSTLPVGQITVAPSTGVVSTLPVSNQITGQVPSVTDVQAPIVDTSGVSQSADTSVPVTQAPVVDTSGTTNLQGTPAVDTAASLAAQQAASAATVASQNAQNASQAASSLATSGQVSSTVTTAAQTAAQIAAQAAQNAAQNATVANNAAVNNNTTVAQQASTAANQNAQVTNNIVTGNTNVVSDLPVNTVTPEKDFSDKTITDVKPTIPETPVAPVIPTAPSIPPGEFIFKPIEQEIINTILTPATPTTPTKPVTPPKTPTTPNIPFIPFFPTFTSDGTTYVDYGQPEVPPPNLYGIFNLPPPEYTRAYGPMANVGIMSGATQ